MGERHFDVYPDDVKNLSTVIADRLAGMIHTGALRPGEHLVQTDLAERFGVSRVAVRDALGQLRQRGLAVNVPRKGTIVRPLSGKTVRDLFAVRRVVEGLAAREACRRMTDEDLERVDQIVQEQEELAHRSDMVELIEKDWEFHQAIYDRCDNEPLNEIIAGLWSRTRQARGLAQLEVAWGREWGRRSAARHRCILEALRERDGDRVERLIVETIALAEEELVQGLRETGWGEKDAGEGC
jgi:DNA-binding GntR family transcriptional regulator